MKGILLLTGILFICTTCFEMPESPIKKKDNRNAIEKYWDSGGIGLCLSIRSDENRDEIVDNRDGTISRITFIYSKNDACPWQWGRPASKSGSFTTPKLILKKCLQGQVYRKEQNDCKGAGTAANYWNAQKFQWCSTNISTCTDSESPARTSCLNDTTVGRKWTEPSGFVYSKDTKDYFKQRPDEIPFGPTDYYWGAFFKSVYNINGESPSPAVNYDSPHYVLCY